MKPEKNARPLDDRELEAVNAGVETPGWVRPTKDNQELIAPEPSGTYQLQYLVRSQSENHLPGSDDESILITD